MPLRHPTSFPLLFTPLALRGHVLRNRVVFTAHTASFSQDGVPGPRAGAYYEARAAGGAAMIVFEPLPVLPSGGVTPQNYRFDDDRFVPGLRAVADAVHRHATMLVSQLYHLGPNADPTATCGSSGACRVARRLPPRPGECARSTRTTSTPSWRLTSALPAPPLRPASTVSSACSPATRLWTGSCPAPAIDAPMDTAARSRTECASRGRSWTPCVRRSVRTACWASPSPLPCRGYVDAVAHLHERCDVDYFGIGNGDYDHLELLMPPLDFEPGVGVPFARAVKRVVPGAVVIAEGRITRPEIAERALSEGSCDLVGMTRAQIADPELVRKTADGRQAEIRECVALNVCVARRFKKFPIACVQNPQAGFEARPAQRKQDPRRVVVIGGGVAGLEAARAAAAAGHVVTLLERAGRLGGQVALTADLPFQQAHRSLIDWRVGELERLGVDIEVGVDASADTVAGLEPDIALVATGSEPDNRYEGATSTMDILRGVDIGEGPAVVVDEEGHRKATGVAELLAATGRDVTIVGDGIAPTALLAYALAAEPTLRRLDAAGVRLLTNTHVAAVEPGRVRLRQGSAVDEIAGVVVHAGRHRAVDGLVGALRAKAIEANAIGDARAPRLVEDAIRDGYEAVSALP